MNIMRLLTLLVALTLVGGCICGTTEKTVEKRLYICPDGSEVEDRNNCPTTTTQTTSSPQVTTTTIKLPDEPWHKVNTIFSSTNAGVTKTLVLSKPVFWFVNNSKVDISDVVTIIPPESVSDTTKITIMITRLDSEQTLETFINRYLEKADDEIETTESGTCSVSIEKNIRHGSLDCSLEERVCPTTNKDVNSIRKHYLCPVDHASLSFIYSYRSNDLLAQEYLKKIISSVEVVGSLPSAGKISGFVGQPVTIDDLEYTVTKVETYNQIGSEMFGKKTEGLFYKIYLRILNKGNKSHYLYSSRVKIVDSQEREFDEDTTATIYIKDAISFGEQLQPGLAIEGAKIFNLPKDATGLNLIIRGDWLSVSEMSVIITENNIAHKEKETTFQDSID